MGLRSTVDFLLYQWLNAEGLGQRPRFADHTRETFDAVLDTCERIAREKYAPFNRLVDTQEPRTEVDSDGALRVVLPQATHDAHMAYVESGMLAAAQDYELGGMQLPFTVSAAANSFFALASISIGSNLLTSGNASCIMACGTQMQKDVFAANEFSGRWAGTMCLSEPQAGSSLSDIATKAVPDVDAVTTATQANVPWNEDPLGPRYRLRGNKMWISSGEHELTENIIHLVLAKIPDENGKLIPGVKGISLFIVPKRLVHMAPSTSSGRTETIDGVQVTVGARNDVALAGLNHKLGWRGTTNTLLNFGEGKFPVTRANVDGKDIGGPLGNGAGAIGYLVGQPGEGLRCMFHMMNEARIGIGMAATMLGLAGYYASLDYAKNRPQGRLMVAPKTVAGHAHVSGAGGTKDANSAQVRLIEHADIKRMLLAQKSICEGALALQLYCARLVDEQRTGAPDAADEARLLLEVLTPIAKSWPSENCLEANSLAIQIHGGYGYTRDFPVEQYWRDQRLNMIHEGTHGIQAMDLLGRKVLMEGGRGLQLLASRINATARRALQVPDLAQHAVDLTKALGQVDTATRAAWATGNPLEALPNAVPYMQAFGHTVIAWMWLDVALAGSKNGQTEATDAPDLIAACAHIHWACGYFYRYELPKTGAWLQVVTSRDMTCAHMPEDAF